MARLIIFFIFAVFLISCSAKGQEIAVENSQSAEAGIILPQNEATVTESQTADSSVQNPSDKLESLTNVECNDEFANEVIPFRLRKSYGMVDSNLNVLIAPKYSGSSYANVCNYMAVGYVLYGDDHVDIFDCKGNKLWTSPAGFRRFAWVTSKLCLVRNIMDGSQLIVELPSCKVTEIPKSFFLYDSNFVKYTASDTNLPLAIVDMTKQPWDCSYYSADLQSALRVPFITEHLLPMVDDAAVVVTEDFKLKIIDADGNVVLHGVIESGWNFTEGLLPVVTVNKSGFINNKGEFCIECPISRNYYGYERSPAMLPMLGCSFSEGVAYVPVSENEWNLYDTDGNIVAEKLPWIQNSECVFRNGLLCVRDKDNEYKCGYINKEGKLVIPCVFDSGCDFHGGYAMVSFRGSDSLVDRAGNVYYADDLAEGNRQPVINVVKGL